MVPRKRNSPALRITLPAMLLAMGLVLPFFTGQIPQVGRMLLPMHIPVLLCGLICGWKYGLAMGFALPLLRSLMFGMPVLPIAMVFALVIFRHSPESQRAGV